MCLFTLSPVKNRTGVATEVLFHAVSHRRSVNGTSKYNRDHTGVISHRCSVNGALISIIIEVKAPLSYKRDVFVHDPQVFTFSSLSRSLYCSSSFLFTLHIYGK